jgi:IclR family mhp operon transcriptional activator
LERDNLVHSVARAFSVVESLNRQSVTSLEGLHRETGLPKPTLVRLLDTLIEAGYVYRVSRREGYAVTESVLRLSAGVRHRDVLVDVARPLLEAFTRKHKWQVSLATYEADGMLIRATTRHISPFSREQLFLNRSVSVLGSVVGRAYFAFCPPEERQIILERAAASDTADAEVARDPAAVAEMVERVRSLGFAPDRPGRPGPYRALAIPVMSQEADGAILGSMVMFWYSSVLTDRQAAERYLDPLCAVGENISRSLHERLAQAEA